MITSIPVEATELNPLLIKICYKNAIVNKKVE
jgi:hypothetical protein